MARLKVFFVTQPDTLARFFRAVSQSVNFAREVPVDVPETLRARPRWRHGGSSSMFGCVNLGLPDRRSSVTNPGAPYDLAELGRR